MSLFEYKPGHEAGLVLQVVCISITWNDRIDAAARLAARSQ